MEQNYNDLLADYVPLFIIVVAIQNFHFIWRKIHGILQKQITEHVDFAQTANNKVPNKITKLHNTQ